MWAAGEFPSVHKFEISGGHEAEVLAEAERTKMIVDRVNASRIHELATVLGVDLHPAIVANEMQKRADAERAATEVLCVCNHGRALHAENGVGRCRGYHRNYTCDRYIANAIAQGSSAT
jgi:hypothetical protein